MNEWIIATAGLAGTALGGAIALLSGTILARRREAEERRRFLLERLEQIYETAIRVETLMGSAWVEALQAAVCHGPVERQDDDRVPLEQLRMLAELYFPGLVKAVSRIESAHAGFGPFLVEAMDIGLKLKPQRRELADDLKEALDNLKMAVRDFLDNAAVIALDLL